MAQMIRKRTTAPTHLGGTRSTPGQRSTTPPAGHVPQHLGGGRAAPGQRSPKPPAGHGALMRRKRRKAPKA